MSAIILDIVRVFAVVQVMDKQMLLSVDGIVVTAEQTYSHVRAHIGDTLKILEDILKMNTAQDLALVPDHTVDVILLKYIDDIVDRFLHGFDPDGFIGIVIFISCPRQFQDLIDRTEDDLHLCHGLRGEGEIILLHRGGGIADVVGIVADPFKAGQSTELEALFALVAVQSDIG